jgi:LysM domain
MANRSAARGFQTRTAATQPHSARGASHHERLDLAPLVWMLVLATFVIAVGSLPTAQDRVPSGQTSTIAIRVSQADTLWTIAASHRLPGTSTARMVELISEANSLPQGALHAGAVLRVPVELSSESAYAQAGPSSAGY